MITRRAFFKWLGRSALAVSGLASYGFAIEPGYRLRTVTYALTPPHWTPGLKLRLVLLSDPHVITPQVSPARWEKIIAMANAMSPDLLLILGDLRGAHPLSTKRHSFDEIVAPLVNAKAKLGVYAILGNHDWWMDKDAQQRKAHPVKAQIALESVGVKVLVNQAVKIETGGHPFWLSGTDSLIAIKKPGRSNFEGRDDLAATLAQVTDDAPVIHLAHEPDFFVKVPDRISLTLSGHSHGGQVNLFGYAPIANSQYGQRFVYGHIVEDGRHLIISGGIGCSHLPVRFGMPPEITVVELG